VQRKPGGRRTRRERLFIDGRCRGRLGQLRRCGVSGNGAHIALGHGRCLGCGGLHRRELLYIDLGLDGLDAAQIFGLGTRGQSTRINLAHLGKQGFRFGLGLEGTEPQAVAHAPVFGALNLIDVRAGMLGKGFHWHADGCRGCTQVDHERAGTAEARRGRERLEQVVDRQIPAFAGQWSAD
jgi:hypothetical protein